MDHEISSSQLSETQVGWDWLSVRFNDQTELMLYILRDVDETLTPTPSWFGFQLMVISPMGPDEFTWKTLRRWKSPDSQSNYPVENTYLDFAPMVPYQLQSSPSLMNKN